MVGPAGGNRGRWAAAGCVSAKLSTFRRRPYLCNCGGVHHSAKRSSVLRNPHTPRECSASRHHCAESPDVRGVLAPHGPTLRLRTPHCGFALCVAPHTAASHPTLRLRLVRCTPHCGFALCGVTRILSLRDCLRKISSLANRKSHLANRTSYIAPRTPIQILSIFAAGKCKI